MASASRGSDGRVPLVRPLLPPLDALMVLLEEVWRSGQVANGGPMERRFERQLQTRLSWRNVVTTASCTVGLQLLALAMKLEGEVIVPAFTHPATYQAMRWNNLALVPADVDPDSLTIAPESIPELITSRTSAILAVHLFGHPADMTALERLARRFRIALLADAASGVAVSYLDRPLSAYGDGSVFSFHATKILGTAEGGAVSCADPKITERIRQLRNFGLSETDLPPDLATNGKFNDVLAAIGIAGLELLPEEIAARGRAYRRYSELLQGVEGLSIVQPRPGTIYNHAVLAIRVRDLEGTAAADKVMARLHAHGIDARRYFGARYRMPLRRVAPTPAADAAAEDVLCLPLWGSMSHNLIERICDLTRNALHEPVR